MNVHSPPCETRKHGIHAKGGSYREVNLYLTVYIALPVRHAIRIQCVSYREGCLYGTAGAGADGDDDDEGSALNVSA